MRFVEQDARSGAGRAFLQLERQAGLKARTTEADAEYGYDGRRMPARR